MKYDIPKDLNLDEDLKFSIEKIDEIIDDLNKKRDQGLSKKLKKRLNDRIKVLHVYHSNAIEGSQLTLRETQIIVENIGQENQSLSSDSKGAIEAKDLAVAAEYLNDLISGKEPLNQRTLKLLHQLLLKNSDPKEAGKFRSVNVEIKESSHTPPEHFHIVEHIDIMFKWMNRNMHKYNPIEMGSILHHWLTWIHPFSDGNGRVARLFLNFFLLQKGYPEVIIKVDDRDQYYNTLIAADNNNLEPLIDFITKNVTASVLLIEEFINADERTNEAVDKFGALGKQQLEIQKQKHSYQYEVWKAQMKIFTERFKEISDDIDLKIPTVKMDCFIYDPLSFEKYMDLLEMRWGSVNNTWMLKWSVENTNTNTRFTFVFYAHLFYKIKPIKIMGEDVKDIKNPKERLKVPYNRSVLLQISVRRGGEKEQKDIDESIHLVTVGTYMDRLVFGIRNLENKVKAKDYVPKIFTDQTSSTEDIIIQFITEVLENYFNLKVGE